MSFCKLNDEDQSSHEFDFFNNFNKNQNFIEPDFNNIYIESQTEHQIQIQ